MTPKLDGKETGTSLQVTVWVTGTTNPPAGTPGRTHRQLVEESRTCRIDSCNIVAVLDRFGREIFPATTDPDCSDAKARDISAQLSVGKKCRYKRMQLLYEGLWSLPEDRNAARCRFAHPGCCELICFVRKRNLDAQLRQTGTTGKSVKTCPVLPAKIFRFRFHPNQSHNVARLTADEGRWPSSRTCGEMRWTLRAR